MLLMDLFKKYPNNGAIRKMIDFKKFPLFLEF